jgi:nicotinamide mononucleotide transporter
MATFHPTRITAPIKRYFSDWTLFERWWLFIFTSVTIYLFFAWHDSWIGLGASLTGMVCVILTAKGKISNYYYGIANCLLYAYVAYQNKYFGEVLLNVVYYFPMQFVGIYYWKKHIDKRKTDDDVIVEWFSWKERILWLFITIIGTVGIGWFLVLIGSSLPYIGAFTVILSVIAMVLTVKRVAEQWILWIVVDVVTVYMWFYALAHGGNDISVLIMWIAFLANAVYGLINWIRLAKEARYARAHPGKVRAAT